MSGWILKKEPYGRKVDRSAEAQNDTQAATAMQPAKRKLFGDLEKENRMSQQRAAEMTGPTALGNRCRDSRIPAVPAADAMGEWKSKTTIHFPTVLESLS